MSIGQRIKQLIKAEDLTQDSLALKTGITRQTINHAVKGKHAPSGEALSKIVSALPKLNARWLLTGDGNMYESRKESGYNTMINKNVYNQASEDQAEYISEIDRLRRENDELKNKIINLLEKDKKSTD
jgi:transcriptional regulator with XRE-family HTH domain